MNKQLRTRTLRGFLAALFLLAVLGATGCSGAKQASVTGRVSYKGKPVTSGTVVLFDQNGHASDLGNVQPDGTYTIARAPVGTDKVSFDNPPPPKTALPPGQKAPPANDPEFAEAAKAKANYVPTPPQYKDPVQSGLTVEVKSGKNTIDIDLK